MLNELDMRQYRADAEVASDDFTTLLPQRSEAQLMLMAKLLTLVHLQGRGGVIFDEAGVARPVRRSAPLNIAASQTDAAGVPAVEGKIIRVISLYALAGGTATNLTLNSKPEGDAGAAISALLANAANGGELLPRNADGWFQTKAGEALTITTGAGDATGMQVSYIEVPNYLTGDDGLVLTDENGTPLVVPDEP